MSIVSICDLIYPCVLTFCPFAKILNDSESRSSSCACKAWKAPSSLLFLIPSRAQIVRLFAARLACRFFYNRGQDNRCTCL